MNNKDILHFEKRSPNIFLENDLINRGIRLIVDKEFERARDIFCQLLESGSDEVYLYLGHVYQSYPALNPILDYEKAYFYYERSIETTGSSEAHIGIAEMYRLGCFGEIDNDSALEIYSNLVDQGITAEGFLFFIIGVMHVEGRGVKIDLEFAEKYFQKGWTCRHIPSLMMLSYVLFRKGSYLKAFSARLRAIGLSAYYAVKDADSPHIRIA